MGDLATRMHGCLNPNLFELGLETGCHTTDLTRSAGPVKPLAIKWIAEMEKNVGS